MARIKVRSGAVAAGIALALLALGHFGTIQADSGRDFPQCIQSCNETRLACKSLCKPDCNALHPPGPDRATCKDACLLSCEDNSGECKAICQNIKDPPTDEEP